jgi:hypothetical protein
MSWSVPRRRLAVLASLMMAGLSCRPNDQISNANGQAPKGPPPSGGLGNLGGGNDKPDAGLVPVGVTPFPDASPLDLGGEVMEEKCAAESQTAKQVPVDLLLLVDRSGSMVDLVSPNGKSKWELATEALTAFVKDTKSAGLGVGLQYFPLVKSCAAEMDCGFPNGAATAPACAEERACVPASGVLPGLPLLCGARREPGCEAGSTCTPIGHCSDTGVPCLDLGQACPGGVATNVCTAAPRACRDSLGSYCSVPEYERLPVPLGELPAAAPALSRSLASTFPYGATPTDPAVEAGINLLKARARANPDRHEALVLVTDGLPNSCKQQPVELIASMLTAAKSAAPSIATYAIGVFGPQDIAEGQRALESWAMAGGTGTPFVLSAGDDLSQKLIDALNQIRGSALPCEYTIPKPSMGMLDWMKVNVRVTAGSTGTDLGYVGSPDKCDPVKGGWHYDIDPAVGDPQRVIMCEATCKNFKMDIRSKIELLFGCKTIIIE